MVPGQTIKVSSCDTIKIRQADTCGGRGGKLSYRLVMPSPVGAAESVTAMDPGTWSVMPRTPTSSSLTLGRAGTTFFRGEETMTSSSTILWFHSRPLFF